jgi:hypothetical protein
MVKTNKDSKNPAPAAAPEAAATEAAPTATATAVPQDVTVPVEGAETTAEGEKKKVSKKDSIPEHLKKGNRTCAACLTPEADFLAKNPRYSLCQGVDVLCYRKGDRVIYGSTLAEVNVKYPDKVGQLDDKQRPLISEVGGQGIKPGILVRGAIKYSRKAADTANQAAAAPQAAGTTATPVPAAADATGSAGTTSAG